MNFLDILKWSCPKQQIKAKRKQTSVNINNKAFSEYILTPSTNYNQFLLCPGLTKADIAPSILKGLVTNNGIDRLGNGNQRRRAANKPLLLSPEIALVENAEEAILDFNFC